MIMNEEEKKKWGLGSRAFYPRLSIVDPSIQSTLPRNQTVNGACDTLAHVFEAYFGGTPSTRMQDELSEGIMRTTMDSVRILLDDPSDYDARAELAWAATLALNGLNGLGRAGDWASHGIEHSLSAFTDIAHGEGLAIVFPAWMKYVYREDPEKFARFGEKVFGIEKSSAEDMALNAIEALKEFLRSIGAPVTLRERGYPGDTEDCILETLTILKYIHANNDKSSIWPFCIHAEWLIFVKKRDGTFLLPAKHAEKAYFF